jgi:hypothetical protein
MHDPDPIVETLSELRHGLPALAAGRGWQAEQTLHHRAALCPLVQCIEQGVHGILCFLRIGDEAIEITGCRQRCCARRSHKPPCEPDG